MLILNDFTTSVRRALSEIDPNWESYNGLIVAGTHNQQNVDEIIDKIKYARDNKLPALLICAGYQLGAIQWARDNGIPNATSEEFGQGTFVVKKRPELKVGIHEGENWWSNYEVSIAWDIPDNFVAVPYHPEYSSTIDNPHPLLVKFINLCKK